MKKLLTLILAVALCAPAFAQVKIKVSEEKLLVNSIKALDGIQQVVHTDGKDSVILVPYKLPGNTRRLLAKDLRILQAALDDAQKAWDQKFRELSPDGSPLKDGSKESILGQSEFEKINSGVDDLPLAKIHISDLNLDDNAGISSSVLAGLDPIIEASP